MSETYRTRRGEEFQIRQLRTIQPQRHRWHLFDVWLGTSQSLRGIMVRQADFIIMQRFDDYTDAALDGLALKRLQIALEKSEADDPVNMNHRPDADFHHVLELPNEIHSMAQANADLDRRLQAARTPKIAGFGEA